MNPTDYLRQLSPFQLARLKLTGWYLLILMLVSVIFSIAIFNISTQEVNRGLTHYQSRFSNTEVMLPNRTSVAQALRDEAADRLRWTLIEINLGIFCLSAAAAYFLAGRTLRPIQQAMDEQNQFVADASHELRTPITALRTSTEVALRDKKLSASDTRELLRSNLTRINDIGVLAESLLLLAKGEPVSTDLQKVTAAKLTEDAITPVISLAEHKKITITNQTKAFSVLVNPPALTQALVILLDNAIKYSPKGSEINLTSAKTDHRVQITVSDQGNGVTAEDLPYIFDRFYRSDKSRSKEISGHGLGLSIAKKIVTEHKGTISVLSRVGHGSKFTVTLPAA